MKAAIVGCGSIANVHAASILKMQEHELVAAADIKIDKAIEFTRKFGGRPYASLEEMLAQEEIDVLHICTPHYLHTPMAIYVLEQDVNVFMEKPPVISFQQLKQLKNMKTSKKLGFCFQNRYNPSVIKVKEMLASGETGKILGARGIVTWNRDEEYYSQSDWRGKLHTEGGGALINQSIHTLDLLHYFVTDTPKTIDAMMTNHHLKEKIEVEDTLSAYITYEESRVNFYTTTSYVVNSAPFIELECENMRIRMEDMALQCYLPDGSNRTIDIDHKVGFGKSYWGSGHEDCIKDFYDSIMNKRRFLQDLEGVEDTIRLMLLIYKAARSGREQSWDEEENS